MQVQTKEGKIFNLDSECIAKSIFLSNISTFKPIEPIELLVDAKTMQEVLNFMKKDKHVLEKDFNPLEISFSDEFLCFFDFLESKELLDVCNAANYLEYPFLLELTCKKIAMRISENPQDLKSEIFGEGQISEEDLKRITSDFDWMNDNL